MRRSGLSGISRGVSVHRVMYTAAVMYSMTQEVHVVPCENNCPSLLSIPSPLLPLPTVISFIYEPLHWLTSSPPRLCAIRSVFTSPPPALICLGFSIRHPPKFTAASSWRNVKIVCGFQHYVFLARGNEFPSSLRARFDLVNVQHKRAHRYSGESTSQF